MSLSPPYRTAPVPPSPAPLASFPAERASHAPRADVVAVALLALLLAVVVALTWRRWGVPELDAGAELTTADLVAHGATPYADVRYFYGPLGLYGLAATFRAFGTGLGTAYAFGLAQTVAILAVFYALARHWLRPLCAALATAMLLAIGFSGTAFDFVLPHTNSATVGLLALLGMLLALSRDRPGWAGVAAGLVGLTRPEYVAVAIAIGAAYLVGLARERRGGVRAAAVRLGVPGVLIPAAVLGALAVRVGAARLFTENLWPVDFLRVAGFATQERWMPLTLDSVLGLVVRAGVYGGLLAGAVATALALRERPRLRALWPLVATVAGLAAVDVAARATGVLAAQRAAVEAECRGLLIGMSWLPALGFAVGIWMAVAFVRGRPSPLGRAWPADLALVAAATALGVRAYNAFTPEGSYATYYAAPLVLLAAILHERIGDRWPSVRPVAVGTLALVAAALLAHAQIGLYADRSASVDTARGSFHTSPASAAALGPTLRRLAAQTRPGERILAVPANGGLYFLADRRPALYELMLLPGLLDTRADEEHALSVLRRERVRTVVLAARDFRVWGWPRFGRDYNRTLGAGLGARTVATTTFGRLDAPAAGTYPSRGFQVLELGP
ncbi:MAG: hypothetical protein JWO02_2621 [Solirubrobacterales bacterium]|nr:hypothetical protein [Solirubrobacterales bacterium]